MFSVFHALLHFTCVHIYMNDYDSIDKSIFYEGIYSFFFDYLHLKINLHQQKKLKNLGQYPGQTSFKRYLKQLQWICFEKQLFFQIDLYRDFLVFVNKKELQLMQITIKNMNFEQEINGTQLKLSHQQEAIIDRLKQLEGQCKVHSFRPLQIDILKTVILIVPLVCSLIGLLLLKYFKSLRVKCFYKDCRNQEATYFYIESKDGHEQIERTFNEKGNILVFFKSLKYKLIEGKMIPLGYQFQQNFNTLVSKNYLASGLSQNIRANNRNIFGKNEHRVEVPNYFEYMFDILTKPLFLFQYVICILLILERLILFAVINICFSVITTSINYYLLYRSFTKIKEMAQRQTDVIVIREGKTITVKNHDLVPGDIVVPQKNEEISYDGILLDGQVFVNQASLTGQSIPVGKFPAQDLSDTHKQTAWIVEGAKVLQVREESRVLVVNIGYATRRGRIIRKILTRVPKVPDFFRTCIYFLLEACAIGIIIYLCTINMMKVNGIIPIFIVFRFFDILNWSFPPSFPIFFNLSNSFSLTRLKMRNIIGTEPQKTTQASNIKTFCFDKTGTLTQNEIQVYQIIKFSRQKSHENITKTLNAPDNILISKLFASCHTTRQIQDGFLGDEVDLRMFLHSEYKMSVGNDPSVRFIVERGAEKIEVLRINQFEYKFQNMSVLVRDTTQKRHYVFIKGAPERIDKNSVVKYSNFETLVSNLSLGGYRTIAYGYKEIDERELSKYLQGERDIFQQNITALGLAAFENKLKVDTRSTIDKLNQSDIESKMITGDNIFIAVETGFRAGILRQNEKIVLLEGRKQTNYQKGQYQGLLLFKNEGQIVQQKIKLTAIQYETTNKYAFAVDNDFLKLKPEPVLTPTTKLFARISPQYKAYIVKRFKNQYQNTFASLSCSERTFGPQRWKVGMCGDGANDLMAIRQADVGIGISDSDASYGASFTINQMEDVQFIVRESKNTCQTIVDIIRYFETINFIKIIAAIILATDVTYFSSNQSIYYNFASSLFMCVFLNFSGASEGPTKKRPQTNLMSFENHFIFWTNIIFPTIGYFGAYYYFYTSPAFINNPIPRVTVDQGYVNISTYTTAVVWLLINIIFTVNVFTLYKSHPFKCKFYQNIPLLILTILNVIASVAFFFITSRLYRPFSLIQLPAKQSGICLLIMGCSLIASYITTTIFMKIGEK